MTQWVSTSPAPLRPGFDFRTCSFMLVEFVVSFHLAPRVFLQVLFFLFFGNKVNTSTFLLNVDLEYLKQESLAWETGGRYCIDMLLYLTTCARILRHGSGDLEK